MTERPTRITTHPGEILREDCMRPLKLSAKARAETGKEIERRVRPRAA